MLSAPLGLYPSFGTNRFSRFNRPDHPQVADTLEAFAELLRDLGEDTRAGKLEARAEEIRARQRDSGTS